MNIRLDKKGGLWIGYWEGGLDYYDPNTGKFKHYKHDPHNPRSISDNRVLYIFEDSNENIWAGTWDEGINRYNPTTDDFTRYLHNPEDPNSLGSKHFISHIMEDYTGHLWISMGAGGLDRLNPETEIFTHYDFGNTSILSAFEDTQKRLWIGTSGDGLYLFDRNTKEVKIYNRKDGLPDETINGILEDDEQNLWLSTFNGISRFNIERKNFKNYTVEDGLQDKHFVRRSSLKLSSGEMLFGGIVGFNLFNPQDIPENLTVPPVYITSFKLFNKPMKTGKDEVLKQNILLTDEIELLYSQNFISLEFLALNYTQQDKSKYKYIMEGFQKEWVDAGDERKVSYTNLNPGEYTFKVIGSNNDNIWNKEGAKIKIIVVPPYWQTWWFRLLFVTFVIGSCIFWYRSRINTIKAQKLLLEKQVRERTCEVVAQKEELESQAKFLKDAYKEIKEQGNKLEIVYSEVKDSIRAAVTIQQSMLPSEDFIKQHFPESFILFKPKDEVSGDFYWFDVKDDNIIIASVDCTGHGVSGAFMAINGYHLINLAIYPYPNLVASEILDRLNLGIIRGLHQQDNKARIYDGMDIAICIISKDKKTLQYAGANNPLYLLRNKEIIQLKADRWAIGISVTGKINTFTNHEIDLEKNDIIYLFSDGYADQLGGEEGIEKFMYPRFREMLVSTGDKGMEQQLKEIEKNFDNWKKDQEQLDDVLVIGFKV